MKTFDELIRKLKSARRAKLEESVLVSQLFVTFPESYDPLVMVTALENLNEDSKRKAVSRKSAVEWTTKRAMEVPGQMSSLSQEGAQGQGLQRYDPEENEAEANTASGRKAVVFMSGESKENCSRRQINLQAGRWC